MLNPRSATTVLMLALLFVGCGDKDDDSNTDDTGEEGPSSRAVVEIVSPADGAMLVQGAEVALEVSVTDEESGDAMDYDAVSWSAPPGWSFDQATGTVTDLPVGEYDLEVTVTIGSRDISDSVAITVEEVHDPIEYRGQLRSSIYLYSNEYELDDEGPCDGQFFLATDEQWQVTGTGECHVELFWGMVDWDVIFQIDGARRGGTVEGTLFFFDDHGTRYEQPYTGTISDTELSVSFDAEHSNADGILAFSGTMEGQAVP
jgi:hypothetical protein